MFSSFRLQSLHLIWVTFLWEISGVAEGCQLTWELQASLYKLRVSIAADGRQTNLSVMCWYPAARPAFTAAHYLLPASFLLDLHSLTVITSSKRFVEKKEMVL